MREQKEETGTSAKEYIPLGRMFATPGFCSEILHLWACRISDFGESCPDDGEFLEVSYIPIRDLVRMVLNNEIFDAKTQIGILKTFALLQEGRIP